MTSDLKETTELVDRAHDSTTPEPHSNMLDPLAGWLTLAMLLVIFVLAFFPFDFSAKATALRRVGFFLTWFKPVAKSWLGWAMNILFFMPFGFAWAWWNRVKRRQFLAGWIAIIPAGLILSVIVEWGQLYLPPRGSSWDDVVMNTIGALCGWLFFRGYGTQCLRLAESAIEDLDAALGR